MDQYKPSYLAEHTKADASVHRLATRTVFATYWYDGKLLNADTVKEELSGGRLNGKQIDLEFSNADGTFSTDRDAGKLAIGNYLQLDHYLPGDSPTTRNYIYGRVTGIDIPGEVATLTVTVEDPDEFSQMWPAKVYTTGDWDTAAKGAPYNVNGTTKINPSTDLGRVYPLCFGRARKVRAVYVYADYDNDKYYYLINRGVIEATNADKGTKINVYRNKRVVGTSEYTVYDGSQASPFAGYAYIVFSAEQSDGANLFEITVDLYGLEMGGATAQRNPASILKWILNDATIGLGQSVNAASFTASATTLSTLGGGSKAIVIDGGLDEQVKLQDLIDHLAEDCGRSFLYKNSSNEWAITTDTYQSSSQGTFGRGDDFYRNIIKVNKYGTPDDRTRELVVRYARNKWTGEFAHSLSRTVYDEGEDRELELPLIQDSEAADLIHCYLQRRELYGAQEIELELGMDARDLVLYQPITVVQKWDGPDRAAVTNINGQFQLRKIERGLYQWSVQGRTNSSSIYTYVAGTLPAAPSSDSMTDYSFTPPSAPTSLAIVTSGSRQGTDGTTSAYYRLSCTPPAANCQYVEFGYKEKTAANYLWVIGQVSAGVWYGMLEGLVPGQLYYFAARAINNANMPGYTQGTLAELTNGGTGYTAPGDTTAPGTITAGTGTCKIKTWRFTWTKSTATDIRDYHVQISTSSAFATTVYDGYVDADYKEFTYDAAAYGTTLYARVKGRDHTGNESASWSSTMSATCSQIIGDDLANLTITAGKIANLTITAAQIANATITATQIANATITATQIANATITGGKIAVATITGSNIDAATIAGSNLINATITGTKIAAATITGSNIAAATISGSNIAAATIAAANIVNSTITATQIAALTITAAQIANLTITGGKIVDATITSAKIDTLVASKITTGTITGQTITISTSAALNINTGSGMVIKKAGDILFEADSSDRGEIIWQLGSSSLTAKLGASYDYKTLDFYPSAANTALLDLGGGAAWKRIWLNGYDVVLGRTNMIGSGGGNDVYLGDYVDSFYPIGSLALGTANDPWTDLYLAGSGSAYWRIFYYYNDVNTDGLWINYNGTGRFVFDGGGNLKLDGQLFQNYWCMDIVQGSEWDLFSGGLEAFRRHDGAYLHKTMRGEKIQTPVVSQKSGKDIVTIMDRKAENKSEYAMVLSDHIQVLYECVHSLKTDMEKLKNAA